MCYPKFLGRAVKNHANALRLLIPLAILHWQLNRDPNAKSYMDQALVSVTDNELEMLELFRVTALATAAIEAHKKTQAGRRCKADAHG